MHLNWGILGPGVVESTRRVRTLGLAASTRLFNDLAVPGLGGVWFGRQLFLATLGVLVAERAEAKEKRVTRISVTNAIEALACWHALQQSHREGEGRIRGSTKLTGVGHGELRFKNVSRSSFYVTQPMRMASVTTLPALGLVQATGSRFNSFSCSADGLAFIEAVGSGCRPYNRDLVEHLVMWVLGEDERVNTNHLYLALSPLLPLPEEARVLLQERLYQGAANGLAEERRRRSEAFDWVRSRRQRVSPLSWDQQPAQITDPTHWADIRAGAAFFATRDAALAVLDELERIIGKPECSHTLGSTLSSSLQNLLKRLRTKAQVFLSLGHTDQVAAAFCKEMSDQNDDDEVLRHLLRRDGRVLRLVGDDKACPGPAFRGGEMSNELSEPEMEESPLADDPGWPEDISYRIRNLWWLSLDLEGIMEHWLHPKSEETNHG